MAVTVQKHVMPIGTKQTVFQAADQVRTNNTLTDSTSLTAPIEANKNYRFRVNLTFSTAGVAAGFKFALTGPASPTNVLIQANILTSAGVVLPGIVSALGTILASALAVIGTHSVIIEGVIENGVNAGSLTVQIAQNTTDASGLTLLRGSILTVEEIV